MIVSGAAGAGRIRRTMKGMVWPWLATVMGLLIAVPFIGPTPVRAADTGQNSPSANGNVGWVSPEEAYSPDDKRAAADRTEDIIDYYNFNIPDIPSVAAITGIEVAIEGYQTGGSPPRQADISLSWDNGSSYTAGVGTGLKTTDLPGPDSASEAIRTFGGDGDTWGRTWTPMDFANDRFRVRLDARLADYGAHLYIDHVQVRVSYIPGPVIEGVTPSKALQGDSLTVTLAGSDLSGTSCLTLGEGITVQNFTVDGPTQITALVTVSSSAVPGVRDITVTNSIGPGTLAGAFLVNPQIVPDFGAERAAVFPDEEVQFVNRSVGGVAPLSYQWDFNNDGIWDSTSVNPCYSYALPGAYTVVLKVTDSEQNTDNISIADFVIVGRPAPDVSLLTPSQGMAGQDLTVVISGTDLTDVSSVSFGAGITVMSYSVDSNSQITVDIAIDGEACRGSRSITVQTPRGSDALTAFSVTRPAPVIEIFEPQSGVAGDTVDIVISGTGFDEAKRVDLGPGMTVKYFTIDSASQITAHVVISPDAEPGARDATVTTASGTYTQAEAFSVGKKSSFWFGACMLILASLLGLALLVAAKRRKKRQAAG